MDIKQKVRIKIQPRNIDISLNQILLELTDFFVLVYSNQNASAKRFKAKRYYWPKWIIDNYNVIINGKNFYDQATGQGEDYTTGCLLDYGYIKSHCRLNAVGLSRQKELDTDTKAIQQIEYFGKLKKLNNDNDNVESMFVVTLLEKIKKTRLTFSQGSVTVL